MVEYWICVEHWIAHWTLNGLLNFEYALNMVHWILNKALNIEYALNVEYGFNIDWIVKLNEDLCVEILNSPLNVMSNLCEIPLVSMVIEATADFPARCNVNATVIPGGSILIVLAETWCNHVNVTCFSKKNHVIVYQWKQFSFTLKYFSPFSFSIQQIVKNSVLLRKWLLTFTRNGFTIC